MDNSLPYQWPNPKAPLIHPAGDGSNPISALVVVAGKRGESWVSLVLNSFEYSHPLSWHRN